MGFRQGDTQKVLWTTQLRTRESWDYIMNPFPCDGRKKWIEEDELGEAGHDLDHWDRRVQVSSCLITFPLWRDFLSRRRNTGQKIKKLNLEDPQITLTLIKFIYGVGSETSVSLRYLAKFSQWILSGKNSYQSLDINVFTKDSVVVVDSWIETKKYSVTPA